MPRTQVPFDHQIVPITASSGVVSSDEGIRRGGNLEKLATLKPAFLEDGVVTAWQVTTRYSC